MSDTKNLTLEKEARKVFEGYTPSFKEKELISALVNKFRNSQLERNQRFMHLDGANLIEYIEDSVRNFTTNVDAREDIEDWQSRIHDPFTRNKVLAILGKVVQALPIAEFHGRGDEDVRRGKILTDLYQYTEELDDYEELMIRVILECIVKGTAVAYEGHERKSTAIRDIVRGDGDNLSIKKTLKKTNRLYGQVVRLEDFYPSSVGVARIKDMPYCFWREILPYQQFLQDYAMFGRSKLVQPHSTLTGEDDRPWHLDYISDDVGEGNVEILKYYNKDTDEYIITANAVWLNPLMMGEEMEVSPLPFKHKELPFWEIKNELFDSTFFYGKSTPDKLKSLQVTLNVLTNMLMDQSFLTVFKPILTNGYDSIEDDYLRPGRRTPIDTQGLSIKDAVVELEMSTPTGWHQYILEYTRKVMEEASLDKVSSGTAGAGDRTTAQEVRMAAEGVGAILGVLGRFVKYGIKRKAMLRGKNILQFATDSSNPLVSGVLGEGGVNKFNKAFNTFKINNAILSNGKRGTKIIEMFEQRQDMPTKSQLKARSDIFKLETKKNLEVIAIPSDYLRGLEFDIELVANRKSDVTKEHEKALHLEKVKIYLSFFPEFVDKAELFAQTAEMMGDDPQKIISEEAMQQIVDPGAQKSQFVNPESQLPQNNLTDNTARGLRGGQSQNDIQQIQSLVQG